MPTSSRRARHGFFSLPTGHRDHSCTPQVPRLGAETSMRLRRLLLCLLLAGCGAPRGPADPGPAGGDPPILDPPGESGSLASIGGCQVFPADNAWNRDVSGEPIAANSAALLAVMSPASALHLDLGTSEAYYGIPYTVVP